MSSWSTLNKGVTAAAKDAVELQVEKLLKTYQHTLKLHQKGELKEAKQKYQELASHDLVKKEPKPKKKAGSTATSTDVVEESPLSTLRFLVFKNYGSLLKDEFFRNDQQDVQSAKNALQYFLQAVKIDPTEYSLWYHIGYLSQTLGQLRFARLAYENGFYVNRNERSLKLPSARPNDAITIIQSGQFTPMQWKCLEALCQVLYDIGDYRLCTFYINIILDRHSTWEAGHQLKTRMENNDNNELNTEDTVMELEPLSIALEKPEWSFLVESLLKEYKRLAYGNNENTKKQQQHGKELFCDKLSKGNRLNDTYFINRSIYITFEEEIEQVEVGAEPMDVSEKEDHVISTSPKPQELENSTAIEETSGTSLENPFFVDLGEASSSIDMIDSVMEVMSKAQKRKREEVEDDDKEGDSENDNDEEDEAEEKRLSLRASKRQREKIANEESSRLKMLEEERAFTDKVQVFYNKIESIPMLYRKAPWYDENPPVTSTNHFWDWFDQKVSELDGTYSWDIGVTKGKDFKVNATDSKSSNSNLSLFILSYVDASTGMNNQSRVAAKNLIAELNSNNSGIVDSLCRLVSSIVRDDTLQDDSGIMDNRLLESITDVITAIQPSFVQSIMLDDTFDQQNRVLILLRVAEYFIDRLIRNTMMTLEETGLYPNSTSNKRRVSTSFIKQSKLKMIEHLVELATYWIDAVEQNLYSLSLVSFYSNINKCTAINYQSGTLTNEEYSIQLRYYVLKGKLAQCNNDIEEAYSWFTNCKSLFESIKSETMSIDVKSMYDSFISPESVEKKLDILQVGKLFATSKQKMIVNDFEGVIRDLEEAVKPKLSSFDIVESSENMQMINMLAQAYYQSERFLDAWDCYIRLFCSLMQRLINYGENQYNLDSRPSKNEDIEFLKTLSHINESMDSLVQLIQKKNKSEEWLPHHMNQELANKLVILLRMSTCYIFRHTDFVPLVNNFTTPDVPPHTPSKITKANGFNDIMIKSWVLQSRLIQHTLTNNTSSDNDAIVLTWAELLQELHDELGEREICGASKSIFIHHLMETLANVDDSTFRREIYQCYHCLYGVHLAAESSMIEEHHCTHSIMNQKASEPLFELVVHSAVEKLQGGVLLKNDLKDVIDTVSELFEDLPTKHPLVKNNQTIIENYLNSEIDLHPSLNMMLRTSIIPTNSIDPVKTNTSMVLYKIFWIRGKTLRLQIKNRAKANNEKNMIDLEKAIEEFTSHIILNPDDTDGWCELGGCYQHLADEELNWSASNIVAHKDLISEYQRKSFHAYMRGLYLGDLPKNESAKNDLFVNFGNLLYSIASPPMNMEAFKTSNVKRVMKPDQSLLELRNQPVSPKSAYKLATIMYNHALRYHTSDRLEWRSYYMTGKCLAKVDRPPKEVLNWYLQAIRRTKFKNGRHDHVLEPIYIFCSALVKYLYAGKLDAKSVIEFLDKERELQKKSIDNNTDQEVVYLGSNVVDNSTHDQAASSSNLLMSELSQKTTHLPTDTANAYNAIFKRITDIKAADNKGWHHRPVYRISWMYYHVYHNIEKAKAEIMKLVTLKTTVKNHINIWKPGFELPGKHYEYINKYTLFIIELSKQSNDTQSLKHLYRKLRRGQTLMLNDKKVFRTAYTAYLEILKLHLVSIHHAKDILDAVKASRLEKEKLEAMFTSWAKVLTEDKSRVDFDLYTILQDLAELRRLTQGFIPNTDAEQDGLDDTIQMCFAAVVFGGINNTERMVELTSATSTDENPNHGKELLDALLLHAKMMLINTNK